MIISAITASSVSLHYKSLTLKGASTDTTSAMICSYDTHCRMIHNRLILLLRVIECSITLIVGCVPTIHGLWTKTILYSAFYSRLRSTFSRMSLTQSRKSERSKGSHSQALGGASGASSEAINYTFDLQYEDSGVERPGPWE